MKLLHTLLLSIFLLNCQPFESKTPEIPTSLQSTIEETTPPKKETAYKVIGIKDGDTLVILMDGKEQTVRFTHVDCPEKKQPFGNKAKQFVSDRCFGTYVTLVYDEKNKYDRYKRLLAEIILEDGRNLNKELVKNGLAWHFKRFSKSEEYAQLENKARSQKIGIWSEPNPIAPWDWRKPKKK